MIKYWWSWSRTLKLDLEWAFSKGVYKTIAYSTAIVTPSVSQLRFLLTKRGCYTGLTSLRQLLKFVCMSAQTTICLACRLLFQRVADLIPKHLVCWPSLPACPCGSLLCCQLKPRDCFALLTRRSAGSGNWSAYPSPATSCDSDSKAQLSVFMCRNEEKVFYRATLWRRKGCF